ncbi:MAG: SPOR domain-containing protein [Bacteroidales bacterium]|nr:SPOR domain-containing protein [Bacteroidales bacterium]MBQ9722972.1 SPOR domain-containing protein [Bacteroidales bacterium]
MKRHYIIVFLASLIISVSGTALNAQETIPEGYELVDSVVYRPVAAVDTTLVGKDVFLLMPSREMGAKAGVKITQTDMVASAMRRQVADNGERTLSGYRVRIFFDNKQTARVESEETLKRFESLYHDVAAYRTYANPYFKVTVGDFRTRSEAVRLLERIKGSFPSAFVVKENIEFPVVDKDNAYVVDTVKVLRPKPVSY